jgi:putative glutamine amidotransferase
VGGGLIVSALDPVDGVIEGLERPDKRFVVAVQWHPEDQAPVNDQQRRLFKAFCNAL